MKKIIILLPFAMFLLACGSPQKKQPNQALIKELNQSHWWILKKAENCEDAGKYQPGNVVKLFPGCRAQINDGKGWLLLSCQQTELKTQLFYAKNKQSCETFKVFVQKQIKKQKKKK